MRGNLLFNAVNSACRNRSVVSSRLLDLPRLPARRTLRTAVPLLSILLTGGL